jgi:O-antigen ligase
LLFIFSLPKFYISNLISTTLTLSLIFQLALSLAQVFLGHSVGGLLYYVGERSVSVGSPNIALATFMGDVVLRAYGTFSHPNILAGWSVVVLLIIFTLRKKLSIFPLFLVALILLLTQSRSALISLFGLVIPLSLLSSLRSRLLYFFFFLIPILYFLFPNFLSRSDLSISERIDLQAVSLRSISHYPLFGTGAEASISTYPSVSPMTRLLQPDHNSVTLFLSWFGAFGVLALLFHFRVILIPIFYHLLPIFPLILLDHYLLTSPQGLFSLIFYLFISRPSDNQVH